MRRNVVVVALAALLVCFGTFCRQKESAPHQTETMPPATPPPAPVNATDTVMTQTTDVGEERPSSEGGVLTESDTTTTTQTTTTVHGTKPSPRTKPPVKPHR